MGSKYIDLGTSDRLTYVSTTSDVTIINTFKNTGENLLWSYKGIDDADGWRVIRPNQYFKFNSSVFLKHNSVWDAHRVPFVEYNGDGVNVNIYSNIVWFNDTSSPIPVVGNENVLYISLNTGQKLLWDTPTQQYVPLPSTDVDDVNDVNDVNDALLFVKAVVDVPAGTTLDITNASSFTVTKGTPFNLQERSEYLIVEVNSIHTEYTVTGQNTITLDIELFSGDIVEMRQQ